MPGRPVRPLISAIAAATLLGLGHAQATEAGTKTFRDWIAGCDNLRGCTALSLPAETASNIGFLKLERSAEPAGAVALSLRLRGEQLKAPLDVQLLLDGPPFPPKARACPPVATMGKPQPSCCPAPIPRPSSPQPERQPG